MGEDVAMNPELKPFSWDRMIAAVEAVRERALRATTALREAEIPYAVAGGNAVAAWVARVDQAAVRNTAMLISWCVVVTSMRSSEHSSRPVSNITASWAWIVSSTAPKVGRVMPFICFTQTRRCELSTSSRPLTFQIRSTLTITES